MDPRDQLRVYNELDDLGLDLVGYYHSHTPHARRDRRQPTFDWPSTSTPYCMCS